MEQAYGDRLNPACPDGIDHARDFGIVQGNDNLPSRAEPFAYGEGVTSSDDVWAALWFQVIQCRPHLPADFKQVFEPLGDDESGPGAATLQQCVGRHSAAVYDLELVGREPFEHAALWSVGCREAFPGAQTAGRQLNEVGECPADIDSNPSR